MKKMGLLITKLLAILILVLSSTGISQNSANAASKCSSSDKIAYKKAKEQFINDNSIIFLANKIKAIIEDARQKKSDLYGRFVDYSSKDLYDLQRQDSSITKAEAHRDSWEPSLRRLSIKCRLAMPSKTQLNPGTNSP